MEQWLEWARGPVFRFALAFMVLGLARHLILTLVGMGQSIRRATDRSLPLKRILLDTLSWLVPAAKIKERVVYSLLSVIFHVALIGVAVFLPGHIALWKRGLGIAWPGLSPGAADALTLIALATIACLLAGRIGSSTSRALSRPQDYLMPLLIAVPLVTGYLVSHPLANPFGFEATLFVHVMSANLLFVLAPLTKLSHMVLVPTTQMVAEIGWHFPADSGRTVAASLGKEGQPI